MDDTLDLRWFCAQMLRLTENESDVRLYQTLLALAPYLVPKNTPVAIPAPRKAHLSETSLSRLPRQRGRR